MTLFEANAYLQLTDEEIGELSVLLKRVEDSPELTKYLNDAWRAKMCIRDRHIPPDQRIVHGQAALQNSHIPHEVRAGALRRQLDFAS